MCKCFICTECLHRFTAVLMWDKNVLQGAKVEGPIPGPDLAPSRPMAHMAPAMAPAPAVPDNPLSFLVQVRACQRHQQALACLWAGT